MILVETKWNEDLLNLNYGDGYDIRVHAVQVVLLLIKRRSSVTGSKMDDIDFNSVKFGFFDVNTEKAIGEFQLAIGLPVSFKLDKITYESIFATLRKDLNVAIVQINEKELRIIDITDDIVDLLPDYNIDYDYTSSSLGDSVESGYSNDYGYGDNNGYGDNPYDEAGARGWKVPYLDSFWSSMKDNADSLFGLFTSTITSAYGFNSLLRTPNFGNGGYTTDSSWGNINQGATGSYSGENGLSGNGEGVTFVDGLLANSIYKDNFDYSRPVSWVSDSKMNIDVNGFQYESSEKHKTFFASNNTSPTRTSGYDITIVYGPNGRFAKKILDVRPRGKSQQIDASGEAIFDIIDFIAKDVIETDNTRK